jgi:hypothetical protein
MARPDAATLRADPKAAAELPADDAGADEHLHATPQHPGFLRLRASRTAAADPPAGHPAVDGAGSTAAADVPTAGPTAAADPPANVSGIDEHLHADVQHPPLLRPGRDAASPGGHPRNPAGRDTGPSKKDPEEKLRAIFFLATHVHELLQGRGLTAPALLMPWVSENSI